MQSEERLQRLERMTDLPLLALALVLIPMLLLPSMVQLSESWKTTVLAIDWFIWAAFAVDLTLKVVVAPRRLHYLRTHWPEVAMVLLPFLRPLRVLRVLRLARVVSAVGLNVELMSKLASQRGAKFVLAAVLVILVAGATLTTLAERTADDRNIQTFEDGIWWSITTMTTVGYGDHYPVTPMGRGVAAALMVLGIAALSAVTASVAAFLVREREDVQLADVMRKLEELHAEMTALRAASAPALVPTGPVAPGRT
jgi:voltage-gated potassium channel